MTRPPDKIRDHISYNPETGVFHWISKRANGRGQPGDRADHPAKGGYRRVPFERKYYAAHRLAWWMVTGGWPALTLDHENCVRDDNRFGNLRTATLSQNAANTRPRRAMPKGVVLHKATGKFMAQITHNNKCRYLGLFSNVDDAHNAYASKAEHVFGSFKRTAE